MKLRSFINQRVATGYTSQTDPIKTGQYYFELRVYNTREAEKVDSTERWKRALVTLKLSTDDDTRVWKALTNLVQAGKDEMKSIPPVLYPNVNPQ